MRADRSRRAFALILLGLAAAVAVNLFALAAHALPHAASDPAPAASVTAAGAGDLSAAGEAAAQMPALFAGAIAGLAGPGGIMLAIGALFVTALVLVGLMAGLEKVATLVADRIRWGWRR